MHRLLQISKRHAAVFVLAVLVSLAMLYPHVVYRATLGNDFHGIERILNDDELYYLARAQDSADGHVQLGNPYLYEFKNLPTIQFFIPDLLLVKPLVWLHVSVPFGYVVYDGILPIVITLLLYAVAYRISGSRWWALLGAGWFIIAKALFMFHRPVSPQFTVIIFLCALLAVMYAYERRTWRTMLAVGVTLGALFYTYTYYWTWEVVFLAVAAIGLWLFGRDRAGARHLVSGLGIGILLGAPYLIATARATGLRAYQETITRLGMIDSHMPSGMWVITLGMLAAVIGLLLWRKDRSRAWLVFAGGVASIIVVNQHVITGKNLEFSSHYLLPAVLWALLAVITALHFFVRGKRSVQVLSLVILLSMIMSGAHRVVAFSRVSEDERAVQAYGPVLAWLRSHAPTDAVVYANDSLSMVIPAYTSQNVWYAPGAQLHFMTDDEVLERFVLAHYFETIDESFVRSHERQVYGVRYIDAAGHRTQVNALRTRLGLSALAGERLPAEAVVRVTEAARQRQSEPLLPQLMRYRVDYVLWDRVADPQWRAAEFTKKAPAYDDGRFALFSL